MSSKRLALMRATRLVVARPYKSGPVASWRASFYDLNEMTSAGPVADKWSGAIGPAVYDSQQSARTRSQAGCPCSPNVFASPYGHIPTTATAIAAPMSMGHGFPGVAGFAPRNIRWR